LHINHSVMGDTQGTDWPPYSGYCISLTHLFVVCVCQRDYCKSNQPVSLKLAVMTGPANVKNQITFDSDPVTDTDAGSLSLPSSLAEPKSYI